MIAAAIAVIVCVGLFVDAYRAAGPEGGSNPGAVAVSPLPTPSPVLSPSGPAASKSAAAKGIAFGTAPIPQYTLSLAGGPGFTIVPAKTYNLVMAASSSQAISRVGYLAPTSPDASYGDVYGVGRSWSVSTTVTGRPYYAAVFIQANAAGTPITCTISINGSVVDSRTTRGAYGRQVCVG